MLDAMMPLLPVDGVAAVTQKIISLQSLYPGISDSKTTPIDYSDPATQAAYVFAYLGANADLIYRTLCSARPHAAAILSQPKPKIACMGGGPGSDLLGLVKFAERLPSPPKKLVVELLDHCPEWWSMWDHTLSTFPETISFLANIRVMNYQKNEKWVNNYEFLESDLFLFSYSLSEAWRYNSNGSITNFIDMIVKSAKKALCLFIPIIRELTLIRILNESLLRESILDCCVALRMDTCLLVAMNR